MKSSRMIFATFTCILAVAVPVLAHQWEGTGTGKCETPDGTIIYPWEKWAGEDNVETFRGKWWDCKNNYGEFNGKAVSYDPIPPSGEKITYEGEWTWFDPKTGTYLAGGTFVFGAVRPEGYGEGNWESAWPSSPPLYIQGEVIP